MKKLVVLHVSPAPPQLGGMEAYMGNLLHSSLVDKHHVRLLNISKPRLFKGGVYDIKTGYAGAFKRRLSITATSYAYSLKYFLKFLFILTFSKIDIVHIHTASYTSFWEKCLYIGAAKAVRRKVVLHIHGALFQQFYESSLSGLQSIIRRFLSKCDAVIALSESWREFFITLVSESKIHVVKNGINVKPFDGNKIQVDKVTFLHIGEVSKRKGIYDIIQAAARLKQNGFVCHFEIVGPGEIKEVKAAIKDVDVADMLTLHGPRRGEEKYEFFKKASCFVLASYGEGLPIAILEALAAGLAVLSTTVGGIPEVITNGENGYLCEPGNIDQIYDAMVMLINDAENRDRMGRINYAYARQQFDIERCAEKISEIYNRFAL